MNKIEKDDDEYDEDGNLIVQVGISRFSKVLNDKKIFLCFTY